MKYLSLFLPLLVIHSIGAHICGHDEAAKNVHVTQNNIEYSPSISKRALGDFSSIRINFDISALDGDAETCYHAGDSIVVGDSPSSGACSSTVTTSCTYTCVEGDILTETKRNFLLTKLLPQAISFYSNALKVHPIPGVFKLPPGGQCGISIPPSYSSRGINDTDLLLFISARTVPGNRIQATGVECVTDQYKRPIVGLVNFNPILMDTNAPFFKSQLGVTIHEIAHVLGFSYGKMTNDFRSKSNVTQPLPANSVVQTKTVTFGKVSREAKFVVTPTVVAVAIEHFGCPELEGVELEDGGGDGTASSHWEKRILLDEIMTGSASINPSFSVFTMALLADAGWYEVDMNSTSALAWGKNAGCSFVSKSCGKWTKEQGSCNVPKELSCTFDHQSKGYCNIGKSSTNLPGPYQYFDDPTLGGAMSLADYCPLVEGYSNGNCADSSSQPEESTNYFGEKFQANSKCLGTTVVLKQNIVSLNLKGEQAGCYPTACISPNVLRVQFGSYWHDCNTTNNGQLFNVYGLKYTGQYRCPHVDRICSPDTPVDNSWPVFYSVEPTFAIAQGSLIKINGSNFGSEMVVEIAGIPLNDITVSQNGTLITGTLGRYSANNHENISSIAINDKVSGKGILVRDSFIVDNEDPITVLMRLFRRHPYYIAGIAVVEGGIIFIGLIYNFKRWIKRKNSVFPQDKVYSGLEDPK